MESANGAVYTSLGHRPRKTVWLFIMRAESPLYRGVFPLFRSSGLQPS
jgi:hypothetical protein